MLCGQKPKHRPRPGPTNATAPTLTRLLQHIRFACSILYVFFSTAPTLHIFLLTLSVLSIFRLFSRWFNSFPNTSKTIDAIAIKIHILINKSLQKIVQKVSCKSVQCCCFFFFSRRYLKCPMSRQRGASTCTCLGWKVLKPLILILHGIQ